MNNRRNAFTLAEMLVVMGIIILFIFMAIPAVRALEGSNSTASSRNELASLINRAREDAVAIQDIRGVIFFIDPASDRVVGVICQAATLQDSNHPTMVMLDAMPGQDSLFLPMGIRVQTMFNGINPSSGTSESGGDDRYLGFNPLSATGSRAGYPPLLGGVILFDANGKLLVKQYGFQMAQPNGSGGSTTSNLCLLLNNSLPTTMTQLNATSGTVSNANGSSVFVPGGSAATAPYSQLGLVIFDTDAFHSQGFSDLDADINAQSYTGAGWTVGSNSPQTASEATEETWIDTHSTPVLINRFNGTLIRGE